MVPAEKPFEAELELGFIGWHPLGKNRTDSLNGLDVWCTAESNDRIKEILGFLTFNYVDFVNSHLIHTLYLILPN